MNNNPGPGQPVWAVVCGTGHRRFPDAETANWARRKTFAAAHWLATHRGTTVGISGMALGFDLWWAEAILDAGMTLGAHIPFPQQAERWSVGDRQRWQRLRDRADPEYSRVYGDAPSTNLLFARNRGMLDVSDAVLATLNTGTRAGGSFHTATEAVRRGMPGAWIDPVNRCTSAGLPALTV